MSVVQIRSGDVFGGWTVLEAGLIKSLCKCACGAEIIVLNTNIMFSSRCSSCRSRRTDLVGKVFGALTVVSENGRDGVGCIEWKCECTCGGQAIRTTSELRAGRRLKCNRHTVHHGHATSGEHSAEYDVWVNMKHRCANPNHPNWKRYGGRGVTVCQRWMDSFVVFLSDMGPRPSPEHTIERINNNKGYERDNCKWATKKQQMRNTSRNHLLTYKGQTKTVVEWAEVTGISPATLFSRLRLGWPPERAISTPRRRK